MMSAVTLTLPRGSTSEKTAQIGEEGNIPVWGGGLFVAPLVHLLFISFRPKQLINVPSVNVHPSLPSVDNWR